MCAAVSDDNDGEHNADYVDDGAYECVCVCSFVTTNFVF